MDIEQNKQVFTDKYDRQIRLWGANGQSKLRNSNILLINCEPSGVETFKNLVLPGIGSITVADENKVQLQDLGKNFFITKQDLQQQKSRAQAVFENLKEMNPDVKGKFLDVPTNELINDEKALSEHNLIVACELHDDQLSLLSKVCQKNNIILVIINTNGYLGRIRVQNGVHTVVETKPLQGRFYDLRLGEPFKELKELADTYDLDSISNKIQQGVQDGESGKARNELMHIPFAIILIKAVEIYKQQHGGALPKTFQEKKILKNEIISKMGEKLDDAENFEQAMSFTMYATTESSKIHENVEGGVQNIFNHPLLNASQDEFWVLCRNLKTFYDKEGCLPVSSNIPDMQSSTENYLKLKEVYKNKFEQDLAKFTVYLGETKISAEEIRRFVQNVCYLAVYDFKPYHEELQKPNDIDIEENYSNEGELMVNDSYQWYIAYRGLNVWMSKNGMKYPQYKQDEDSLYEVIEDLRKNFFKINGTNPDVPISKKIIEELCRSENSKLHNIAAIMGGVASQESVKLITHQFQPMNNTFIYNGVISVSQVLKQ